MSTQNCFLPKAGRMSVSYQKDRYLLLSDADVACGTSARRCSHALQCQPGRRKQTHRRNASYTSCYQLQYGQFVSLQQKELVSCLPLKQMRISFFQLSALQVLKVIYVLLPKQDCSLQYFLVFCPVQF